MSIGEPISAAHGYNRAQHSSLGDQEQTARGQESAHSSHSGGGGEQRGIEAVNRPIPLAQQVRAVLFPGWITVNWLLIAAPVGIVLRCTHASPLAIFIVNFIAIIPMASILGLATEEVALRLGDTLGGLLTATFGNAVELIITIIALAKHEVILVQTSLLGSMLSNLLLVLGLCFFCGGVKRVAQSFNTTVAQATTGLLALSVAGLLVPTLYALGSGERIRADEKISRGAAIILLGVYISSLLFQLKTHREACNKASPKSEEEEGKRDTKKALLVTGANLAIPCAPAIRDIMLKEVVGSGEPEEPEEPEEPKLSLSGGLVTLAVSTALIGVCSEFVVGSFSAVVCRYHVPELFVGLILLPIIGNATEHATAVTLAIKNKMDLAIVVALGSSTQIALLVLPLSVIIGWLARAEMTFVFDYFLVAVVFLAIILVNYTITDGESNWLEGVLLMSLYVIVALATWSYPLKNGNQCAASAA